MNRISAIWVSYNSGEEIARSLASLRAAGTRRELELICVDNASPDGSAARLRGEPGLTVLANDLNLGYARAVNQGIAAATGDAFLVINPDVTVHPGAVDALADFLEAHPRAGIAGARLLNEDGTIQHSCRSFYTFWTILLRRTPLGRLLPRSRALRRHLMLDFDHAAERRVDWVIGACMLARRRAVAEVGAMDERFFLYFEDVDWCYRMGQHGWEVWYVPAAEMTHVHKRASAARNPFSRSLLAHVTSFIRYTEKWNPAAYLAKRYRDVVKALVLLVLDLVAINAALAAATALRLTLLASLFAHTYFDIEPYRRFAVFTNLIVLGVFAAGGLYRTSRRTGVGEELLALLKAGLLAGAILMTTTFLTHERIVSRAIILLSVPLLILAAFLLRRVLRLIHRAFLRYRFDLRRVLVVGTAAEAASLGDLVLRHPETGLELVGRIAAGEDTAGALGGLDDLERVAESERVQEILLAPSAAAREAVGSTLVWCRRRSVDLRVLSDLGGLVSRGASVEDFLGLPGVAYRMAGLWPLQRFFKRLTDLTCALPALALTLLPGLVHGVACRLRGQRSLRRLRAAGKGGQPVTLPVAVHGERSVSDLLAPRLYLAVLRGRLSLVGPLPRPPAEAAAPELRDLLVLRPGLTGYWRRYGIQTDAASLAGMDRLYLTHWSPGLDFQLWLETLGMQLRGRWPAALLNREEDGA
ncbi:MAG: glycosyltransferase [Candidatus Krumholzibacteriota bacterium]|nr:glycosyltransferase [Candidatus Krumholzibacteriota bacterium]